LYFTMAAFETEAKSSEEAAATNASESFMAP
jgi:hypothetical protein